MSSVTLGFCLVAAAGCFWVWRSTAAKRLKLTYYVVFSGIFLTGLGSGIYHYHPDDGSLVLDRLPMTIVFMGMVAAAMEEGISPRGGKRCPVVVGRSRLFQCLVVALYRRPSIIYPRPILSDRVDPLPC